MVQNPSLSIVTEQTTNGNVNSVLTQLQQAASLPPQVLEKGNLSGEGWVSSICTEEQIHSPEPSTVTCCRQC